MRWKGEKERERAWESWRGWEEEESGKWEREEDKVRDRLRWSRKIEQSSSLSLFKDEDKKRAPKVSFLFLYIFYI